MRQVISGATSCVIEFKSGVLFRFINTDKIDIHHEYCKEIRATVTSSHPEI